MVPQCDGLLGQDQFSGTGQPQPIDIASVTNQDLCLASQNLFGADYTESVIDWIISLWLMFWRFVGRSGGHGFF